MKKIFSIILILTLVLCHISCSVAAGPGIDVYVNGKLLDSDQPAMILNGRTLVPLRAICEALKCDVVWSEKSRTAQIKNKATIVAVQIDNVLMTKVDVENPDDRQYITLDVPAEIYNGRTMVPVRAISEAFYALVSWDGVNSRVDITMEYDYIRDFNEYDYAEVEKNGKCGFINKKREVVIPLIYDYVGAFSEWLASVCIDGKYGYINTTGEVIVPLVYDGAGYFKNGMADVEKNGKYGFVNKYGEETVSPMYDWIHSFSENFAAVNKDGKWGFINNSGEVAVPLVYEMAYSFSSGLAMVKSGGRWGYINNFGYTVIPHIYDDAESFGEGLAAVSKNGKWGFIDTLGNELTPIIYEEYRKFSEGLAEVKKDGKWGYINTSGNEVIPAVYDEVWEFNDGLAKAYINGQGLFYINKTGARVKG